MYNPFANGSNTQIDDIKLIQVHNTDYTYTYKTQDGNIIFSNLEQQLFFIEGIATIAKAGKYGLVNKSGEYIVEPIYDYISEFHDDMCCIFHTGYNKFCKNRVF